MNKLLITALLAATAGALGHAAFDRFLGAPPPTDTTDAASPARADESDRLRAQLAALRDRNAQLEQLLRDQIARVQALQDADQVEEETLAALGADQLTAQLAERQQKVSAASKGTSTGPADPLARYLSSGMDPALAAQLKSRNDEMRLARMTLRDQAEREGWLDSPRFQEEVAAMANWHEELRPQIGDEAYDQFLYASGRSNRVMVREVLEGSAAAQAGLQTGDTILSYGDERIFDTRALQDASVGGRAGAQTLVEVLRNGERISVYVPRGPLGAGVRTGSANPAFSGAP